MLNTSISYQSFCWVIGTTSFRTAKLNLKIEQQLLLLDEFYRIISKESTWIWNNRLQEEYYDFMKKKGFLSGEAQRKDKDAREKTSGLVDIGLVTSDRLITDAGRDLLNIASKGIFDVDNIFNVDRDSFIYLKQLLKTTIKVNGSTVRPFLVVIKCLTELDCYLSNDEFTYLIPMISDEYSCDEIINSIQLYRDNKIKLEDVIHSRLITMKNYEVAFKEFRDNVVSEDLICLIGMNRKSRSYDKPYFELYKQIKNIFIDCKKDYEKLLIAAKKINQKPGVLWRTLLFGKSNTNVIKKKGKSAIADDCPFLKCRSENELKELFFKYLHVYKAMATLSDYFDLNRRYFSVTDIMIFEDRLIKLDLLPKYYFNEIMNELYKEAFNECDKLIKSIPLGEISGVFNIDISNVYSALSKDLGTRIETSEQASIFIKDERYRRFNALIDKKFNDATLIELLNCFKERNDKRIEVLVTDEATIPTIFEYILGIIWYKVSERKGDILDFMKLSLEANLLPKTHAAGGCADIIYEYEKCAFYPKHSLLIEATLTDGNNQRRMEMEPVSRHLGEYRIRFDNSFDYTLFISTYLDENVVSDFRYRKITPYTKNGEKIDGMKIIPIDTDALKKIIENKVKYKYLYEVFEKYHTMSLEVVQWHERLVREATEEYKA